MGRSLICKLNSRGPSNSPYAIRQVRIKYSESTTATKVCVSCLNRNLTELIQLIEP